eukprot:m.7761 g.7761  ORF g.7761 m.7761 type:complete len:391 (+) comp3771_c0_seq1:322-1494(+)
MKITRIEVYHVAMPLKTPWRTAYGSDDVIETVITKMYSGDHGAYGEACPLAKPTYCDEHAAGVFVTVCRHFAPFIVGKDFDNAHQLLEELKIFKGNQYAKAALETAFWGLLSVVNKTPLSELFSEYSGIPARTTFDIGADFGICDTTDELLDNMSSAFARGAPRIKLKCGKGWDINMLEAVRERFPADDTLPLHIDCNGGYDLENDKEFFSLLDKYKLAMIEQPLLPNTGSNSTDLHDHATLATMIKTPICLDESLNSLDAAKKAIELKSAHYFNIKPARCGGVSVALDIMQLAKTHGIPCWVGGMLESCIGVHFCAALACLDVCTYPADLFPSSRFYVQDLASPEVSFMSGEGQTLKAAPHKSYHDVSPVQSQLQKMTISSWDTKDTEK